VDRNYEKEKKKSKRTKDETTAKEKSGYIVFQRNPKRNRRGIVGSEQETTNCTFADTAFWNKIIKTRSYTKTEQTRHAFPLSSLHHIVVSKSKAPTPANSFFLFIKLVVISREWYRVVMSYRQIKSCRREVGNIKGDKTDATSTKER